MGSVALVTGASSGIGAVTAGRLASAGYRVYGTSRHPRADDEGVRMVTMDVRDEESVRSAVADITDEAGRIDLLINNAGVLHVGMAEETSREQMVDVFETNFFGTVRVTDSVLPQMRERRHGRVINVGSLAAWFGEPGEGFYAASKAALARYTEALRHEVGHLGIHVSLVEPGIFNTNVFEAASSRAATSNATTIADYDGPREAAHRTLHTAVERGAAPQHVAAVIARVARDPSPQARYGAGREARWIPPLTTLLPQRLTDRLLRRAYRLPRRPRL